MVGGVGEGDPFPEVRVRRRSLVESLVISDCSPVIRQWFDIRLPSTPFPQERPPSPLTHEVRGWCSRLT